MHALIDSDIFLYEFGACTDSEYKPLSWPLVQSRVQGRINGILEATQADTHQLYLTANDNSNFRIGKASIRPYKGHRSTEKPYWYDRIRSFLIAHRGAEEVSGWEADDQLSIEQWEDYTKLVKSSGSGSAVSVENIFETVICSRDKDLHMVPGYHYSWSAGKQQEKEMWWVDELTGLKSFYKQCLTGDAVDNIPGLYGVGSKSSLLSRVDSCDTEHDMYLLVKEEYIKRYGSYWRMFLEENSTLLWMLRTENRHECIERMEDLERQI